MDESKAAALALLARHMRAASHRRDAGLAHARADDLLADALAVLGEDGPHGRVVKRLLRYYRKTHKWYE